MDIKYGKGLEFDTDEVEGNRAAAESEEDDSLQKIIRDGYRVPVGSYGKISLDISGVRYSVFNISAKGLAIYLDNIGDLVLDSVLKDMTVHFDDKTFSVEGVVVHVSFDELHYICGIQLTKTDDEYETEVLAYLKNSRNELFASID